MGIPTDNPTEAAAVNQRPFSEALTALRPSGELWLLSGLMAAYGVLYILDDAALRDEFNKLGPALFAGILFHSSYRIATGSRYAIWAPVFWFRVTVATYFGIGATVPHVVNEETRQYIYSLYNFDSATNFKVNAITCAGTIMTLAFAGLMLVASDRVARAEGGAGRRDAGRTILFAIAFLCIGGGLRYGYVVPYTFGWTESVLPGVILTISKTYYVGLYLLLVYGMRHHRLALITAAALAGADAAVSVVSFSKSELLILLVFLLLGFLSNGVTATKGAAGAVVISAAFFVFQPLIGYGRDALASRYGEPHGGGLHERWDIVKQYYSQGDSYIVSSRQDGLLRLSYLNVDAYVVDQRDVGRSGASMANAGAVFVPRSLWPNKPIITNIGPDLYYALRGRLGSASGLGVFSEAYWNFGWFGIPLVTAVLSIILVVFSRLAVSTMMRQDWISLPLVLIGLNIAIRSDGFFVPDVMGPAWTAAVFGCGVGLVKLVWGGTRSSAVRTRW